MLSPCTLSPSASSSSLLEVTDHLEIDRFDTRLGVCPLLSDPSTYNADTVDLTRDPDARSYWLQCFEDSLNKFADRAVESQREHSAGNKHNILINYIVNLKVNRTFSDIYIFFTTESAITRVEKEDYVSRLTHDAY